MFDKWATYFSEPTQINVFTQDDIDCLKEIMFKKHTKRREKDSGTIHFMFDNADILPFLQKIPIWTEELLFDGNFYISPHPYLPHADTTTEQLLPAGYIPYKTVLIPLLSKPNKNTAEDFSLVLFHQKYIGWGRNFVKNDPLWTHTWNTDRDYDADSFFNKKTDTISQQQKSNFFSHLNENTLEHFSIDEIFPWTVGTAMIFDSCQVHASVNHRQHGGLYKSGLNVTLYTPLPK